MKDIKDLRQELLRRKAAQPAPEPRKSTLRYVMMASFVLVVLAAAAVAAVSIL